MDAPERPLHFRGDFTTDVDVRDDFSVGAGPLHIRPEAVARPDGVDALSALVCWAASEGHRLVPRGAGTGMPGGNVGSGVTVDLTHFTRMDPVDAERKTMWVEPGVVADRIQDEAARSGLFLPPMPSSSDRCTIGGMVANNAAGARTFRYGAMREWVETLDVVTADGEQIRLKRDGASDGRFEQLRERLAGEGGEPGPRWPSVRKNASGYALNTFLPDGDPVALMVGSEGTLGLVSRIELRLSPTPERRTLVLVSVPDLEALAAGVEAAEAVGASACEFFGRRYIEIAELAEDPRTAGLCRGAAALLLVELDGSADDAVDRMGRLSGRADDFGLGLREVTDEQERADLWRIRHAASPVIARQARHGLVSMQFIEDCVVPPAHLPDYLRGLDEILSSEETDAVVFGHAGDGNVHVNPLVDVKRADWRDRVGRILDRTVTLVSGLGGTLTGEHGDGRIRGVFHDRVWGPELSEAFRVVKSSLDPSGVLNPGVVVALPGQDPLEGISPSGGRR